LTTTTDYTTLTLDELSLAITYNTDPTTRQHATDELHTRALELDHHRTTLLTQDDTLLGLILHNPTGYLSTHTVVTTAALRNELHRRALLLEEERVDYLASSDGFLGVRVDHGRHDSFLVSRTAMLNELHRRAIRHGHERDAFLTHTGACTLGRLLDRPTLPIVVAALDITADTIRGVLHTAALEEDTDRPHLKSYKLAIRHLATLIHADGMDGQDVDDMDSNLYSDRPQWEVNNPRPYRFAQLADRALDVSAQELLHSAVATVLGW
jgi:hypothetical protein